MEKVYTSEVDQIIKELKNEILDLKSQLNDIHSFLFPKRNQEKTNVKKLSVKEKEAQEISEALQKIKKAALKKKVK